MSLHQVPRSTPPAEAEVLLRARARGCGGGRGPVRSRPQLPGATACATFLSPLCTCSHHCTQLCLPACLHPATAQQTHLWVSVSAGAPPGEVGARTSPPTWEVSVSSTTHTFLIKFGSVTTLLWFAGDESWLKEIARVDVKEWTNSLSM